jgi:hypothetical protein
MNSNLRTAALVAAGIVSAGSVAYSEEAKMNPVETALTATTISGYVSASAFFDLGGEGTQAQLPGRSFDGPDKLNRINLDVVKLSIEKPLDEGDWSAGYKVDLLFGPDANTLNTSSIIGGNDSDFGIKQAYVALQAPLGNGLIAKVGVFDTTIGYEVFESGNNPNYSRSYGYFIEPTQHTGLLLSYAVTDWLSISGGIADAYDARINAAGTEAAVSREFGLQTYLGSIAVTAPEGSGFLEGSTFYGGVVHGLTSTATEDEPRTSWYAGLTVPTPVENLAVGLAFDYRNSDVRRDLSTPPDDTTELHSQWATAIAGYVTYQATEQLKLSARGEWAKGTAGTWSTDTSLTAAQDEYFGLTATADYSLWANVLTRLEFRWDNDLGDGSHDFGSTANPQDSSFIVGLNVLYKF